MPQLDKLSFFSQYFYLVLSFFSLYFLVLRLFFPSLISSFLFRGQIVNFFFEYPTYYFCHNYTVGTFYQRERVLVVKKPNFSQADITEFSKLCLNAGRNQGIYEFSYFCLITTGATRLQFLVKSISYKYLSDGFKNILLNLSQPKLFQINVREKFDCSLNFPLTYLFKQALVNFVDSATLASNLVLNIGQLRDGTTLGFNKLLLFRAGIRKETENFFNARGFAFCSARVSLALFELSREFKSVQPLSKFKHSDTDKNYFVLSLPFNIISSAVKIWGNEKEVKLRNL